MCTDCATNRKQRLEEDLLVAKVTLHYTVSWRLVRGTGDTASR